MSSEAYFTALTNDDGTTFTVHPAKNPLIAYLVLLTIGFGLFACLWIAELWVMGRWANAIMDMFLLAALCFGVAKIARKKPSPVDITANRTGIRIGPQFYPLNDIAELSPFHPTAPARQTNVAFAGTGGFGLAGALGAAGIQGALITGNSIGAHVASRSLALTLRKRSHSTPVTLIKGLTLPVAQALIMCFGME